MFKLIIICLAIFELQSSVLTVGLTGIVKTTNIVLGDKKSGKNVNTVGSTYKKVLNSGKENHDSDFEHKPHFDPQKQKQILNLFTRPDSNNSDPAADKVAKNYNPADQPENYKNHACVVILVARLEKGQLTARLEIFSFFNDNHRFEMICLFEAFFYAKDYPTFYKTAAWARKVFNTGIFVYALSVAVYNRPDTKGIILPPLYEIYPYAFVSGEIVGAVCQAQIRGTNAHFHLELAGGINDPLTQVAYFPQDIGLNAFFATFKMINPIWWKPKYEVPKPSKGEKFLYLCHLLVVHYEMELLSNGMGEIWDAVNFGGHLELPGVNPKLVYMNGYPVPLRPENLVLIDGLSPTRKRMSLSQWLRKVENILTGINSGFFIGSNGKDVIFIDEEILGCVVEGSTDSVNLRLYGSITNDGHVMIAYLPDPWKRFDLGPALTMNYITCIRDPAFLIFLKFIDTILLAYKQTLPPYTDAELGLPEVEITKVEIGNGNLETFFDDYSFGLYNLLDESQADLEVSASVPRLNHKPFTITIYIFSTRNIFVVFRIFLVPKRDSFGRLLELWERSWKAKPLDAFCVALRKEENIVKRKSQDFSFTSPDPLSTEQLREAIRNGKLPEDRDEEFGWPNRLALPKGKSCGAEYDIFIIVNELDADQGRLLFVDVKFDDILRIRLISCCSLHHNLRDDKALGFPFDREIVDPGLFDSRNMRFVPVTITFTGKAVC